MSWKRSQPSQASDFLISSYPAGTYISTENGYFYIYSDTKRFPLTTKRVLDSWCPVNVVQTTEDHPAIRGLNIGLPLKFRNGSLLYSHATGRMYLISQGKLRHITNPDVLTALGFKRNDAVWVSLDEINLQEKGEPLNG